MHLTTIIHRVIPNIHQISFASPPHIAVECPKQERCDQLPIVAETVFLPLKGKIVYDGIMVPYRVSIDPGIRRDLDETYEKAKEELGIVTSLPIQSGSSVAPKNKKKVVSKSARSPAVEAEDVVQIIIGAIQEFCRTHLNEEYEALSPSHRHSTIAIGNDVCSGGHAATFVSSTHNHGAVRTSKRNITLPLLAPLA